MWIKHKAFLLLLFISCACFGGYRLTNVTITIDNQTSSSIKLSGVPFINHGSISSNDYSQVDPGTQKVISGYGNGDNTGWAQPYFDATLNYVANMKYASLHISSTSSPGMVLDAIINGVLVTSQNASCTKYKTCVVKLFHKHCTDYYNCAITVRLDSVPIRKTQIILNAKSTFTRSQLAAWARQFYDNLPSENQACLVKDANGKSINYTLDSANKQATFTFLVRC